MTSNIDPSTLFSKQELLGRGSYGNVFKGVIIATSEPIAIKIINMDLVGEDIEDIQKEIAILTQLSSPFVPKYHGSYVKDAELWIIMEYMSGGSCMDLLEPGILDECYCAVILRETLKALEYLHGENKIHRDIKAANILLAGNGDVRLADFGVAAQLTATVNKRNTFIGSPYWMAVEVIQEAGYTTKADIWSLGITAIELATGEPPLSNHHPMKAIFMIPKSNPPTLEGDQFSKPFKEFVATCLQKNPDLRPTAKELLKHRFIKAAKKNSILTEAIDRWRQYKLEHPSKHKSSNTNLNTQENNGEEWSFDTVKPSAVNQIKQKQLKEDEAARGTVTKNVANQLKANDEKSKGTLKTSPFEKGTLKPPVPEKGTLKPPSPDKGTFKPPIPEKGTLKPPVPDKGALKSPVDKGTFKIDAEVDQMLNKKSTLLSNIPVPKPAPQPSYEMTLTSSKAPAKNAADQIFQEASAEVSKNTLKNTHLDTSDVETKPSKPIDKTNSKQILDLVILPSIKQIKTKNTTSLNALKLAFEVAEREIPGLCETLLENMVEKINIE